MQCDGPQMNYLGAEVGIPGTGCQGPLQVRT